ncbi:hypothetical protein PHYPSEUDO_013972 [Phytophthora pseudosyringae]|uniref:Carbohydrate-binding protein n=1 Tax=Phytophthora pseudosyringae TaxID=221518 RepID=A0A8T1W4K9_9STRA|nr:hypothetical protein PHYPSEUDO_013972 [Phytophthora pseudosyringae]
MHTSAAVSTFALGLAVAHATPLNIYNQCGESIQLYDNSATESIAAGGSTTRILASGFNGMFRNGVGSQATLAEFSITGGSTWYDISIIPTGSTGPGACGSLEACKAVTSGTGFNTAMQIAPSGCAAVTCMADGCADAYQYPSDDGKTHSCSDTATIDLTFCPGGSGATATTSLVATTSAPTTAAPTPVPTTSAPKTEAPTTAAPTTAAPIQAPTHPPTQASPTREPTTATPQPTTAAPTREPAETPEPTGTETPEPVVTFTSSSSFSTADGFNSSSSSSLDEVSGEDTTISVTPEMKPTSIPSMRDSSGDQTVSTQSEDSGTSVGTYVVSVVGVFVVVAAVAAVAIARRKKQELEALEPKESTSPFSYAGALTPRGEINVMHA